MPVTIIVGGQYGGEGKGKVAHFLAREMEAKVAVRVGGSNSGHTVIDPLGTALILRQLPTASILPKVTCVLGAGSYIDIDILYEELAKTKLSSDRLCIDPNAVVITEEEKQIENNSLLRSSIGSTLSGTGATVIKRIVRDGRARLAKDEDRLRPFVQPAISLMREVLSANGRIVVEGTQGFGLSVLHTPYYPYATSRDTSAAGFLSEAGLSPLDVDDIVLVLRSFPIRVGGNSGPLSNEIDWTSIKSLSNNPNDVFEFTSVTKTLRRVAKLDLEIVRQALRINNPSRIVLNHIDHVDHLANDNRPTDKSMSFISNVELGLGRKINFLGFGPAILSTNNYSRQRS